MLIYKWTGGLGVALHADGILGNAAAQLLPPEGAMWIVTVAAAHQPFVHLVVERLRKGWLYIVMARVTELRLGNREQMLFALIGMYAMATRTPYARFAVG